MLACHTERIGLGTGIVTVYSRTPGLIAQSIASLDRISGGRAILGLGSSGRIVIEDWHGVKFDYPVSRTREYIEIVRMALAGGRVNYDGRFYRLNRFRMGVAPVQERIPIYIASLGQRNLELTGELADGWLPIWTHSEKLPQIKAPLLEAMSAAGRPSSDMTTAPQILSCASDDAETIANAVQQARAHMAFYIGGMGQYYYDLFCRYGYRAESDAVRRFLGRGRPQRGGERDYRRDGSWHHRHRFARRMPAQDGSLSRQRCGPSCGRLPTWGRTGHHAWHAGSPGAGNGLGRHGANWVDIRHPFRRQRVGSAGAGSGGSVGIRPAAPLRRFGVYWRS